jgi:hypothetical protein
MPPTSAAREAVPNVVPPTRLFSSFETWPDSVFYAPIVLYWVWLTIRFRGFLVMLTNPSMPLGGFTADLKSEWFACLGPTGQKYTAPYAYITTASEPGSLNTETDLKNAEHALKEAGLTFPIVAKPDLGKNGTGVRIIENTSELARYLKEFPRNARLVLQKYIKEEGEAGVFYIRFPHEKTGRIASLTLKYFPRVKGDGVSTLRELILLDPRAKKLTHLYFVRHGAHLDDVVPAGEEVRLVSVGNHCKGAIFKNGAAHITSAMEKAFDRISHEMPEFYFGRFDVRFGSLEDLKDGRDFTILEVNGPGSEMTHIWDADTTLFEAYHTIFEQYRIAWEIGKENRDRGFKLPTLRALVRAYRTELALLATYTWEE